MNTDLIKRYTAEVYDEIVGYRRHLHAYPEVSTQEVETTKYLASIMDKYGISYTLNPAGNGLIARIKGEKPGKVLAFRSDIDALPIQEETGLPFSSENPGVMHACGHDCHMAILLAFGLVLARHPELVEGTVVLIFQPTEENDPGGAKPMIATGLLDDVDAYYGYHVAPELKTGEIGVNNGPVMASPTVFRVKINGKSGHGAKPQDTVDPIVIACQLVLAFQTIVSRNVHPCDKVVVSCCQIHSGTTHNIIQESAEIVGTIRTYYDSTLKLVTDRMTSIAENISKGMGGSAEVEFQYSYPAVLNPVEHAELIRQAARELGYAPLDDLYPSMVGEDFSYYLLHKTGAHFFLGVGGDCSGTYYPLHSAFMCPDEKALAVGCEMLLGIYDAASHK